MKPATSGRRMTFQRTAPGNRTGASPARTILWRRGTQATLRHAADTPVSFLREEAAAIRGMPAVWDATVVCLQCRGALTFKKATGAGAIVVWELRGAYCRRSLIVSGARR